MNRQTAEPIVADVQRLWELATSLPDIARALHLPERLVRHVLRHGVLPEAGPQWNQGELFEQPQRGHVSER
jgi:hypothetical protein